MFDTGYLRVARWRGVPLRIHWSMPLGALLFGGFSFAPAFWIGFVVLVGVHELGHALLVRRFGHRVQSIDLTGFGGLTRWSGHATDEEQSVIAWGGVLAQAALLIVTLLALLLLGPLGGIGADLSHVFVRTNVWLMVLNLLPFPPFDGARAWPLLPKLAARLRTRRSPRRPPPEPTRSARAGAPMSEADRRVAELLAEIARDARRARRGS
jgi:Zn-dependent protease